MRMHAGPTTTLILTAALAAPAAAQPQETPSKPVERRVQQVHVIRDGPGGGEADVVFGGPDVAWFAMGAGPDAVLDDQVKDAPFTAEAVTESVQVLADGNRIVRQATTSLARDGQGRTRREQAARGWGASSGDAAATVVTISDPVSGERYVLNPANRTARALPRIHVRRAGEPEGNVFIERKDGEGTMDVRIRRLPAGEGDALPPLPPPPPGGAEGGPKWVEREAEVIALPGAPEMRWSSDDVQVEELGTRTIEGVEATGTRRTVTIAAGAIGNEQPIRIVSERWYSPELKTVVLSKRSDPRMGEHTYRLAHILKGEPDPSLFQVPPDYTVEKMPQPRVHIEKRVK